MADTIVGMFWDNFLSSERALRMRDLIAIEFEKAEMRGAMSAHQAHFECVVPR